MSEKKPAFWLCRSKEQTHNYKGIVTLAFKPPAGVTYRVLRRKKK